MTYAKVIVQNEMSATVLRTYQFFQWENSSLC